MHLVFYLFQCKSLHIFDVDREAKIYYVQCPEVCELRNHQCNEGDGGEYLFEWRPRLALFKFTWGEGQTSCMMTL